MRPYIRPHRLAHLVIVPTLVLGGILAGAARPETTQVDPRVRAWAGDVWKAALSGQGLEQTFAALPKAHVDDDPRAAAFESSFARLRTNRAAAAESRVEQRAEVRDEMLEEIGIDHYAKALRQAVVLQTLGDDLDDALHDDDVRTLVAWAKDRIPETTRKRQWLDAQELLYLLRTLYEDTSEQDAFLRYDEELKKVNHRVALISRYAPERLHEMRNERAERDGDEPYGEFNPATAVDWRERLDDVDVAMLKSSLHTAASEHIESEGWRPLLLGGLNALRILAETQALADTFPSLADAEAVNKWLMVVDEQIDEVKGTPRGDLDRWSLSAVLDAIARGNDKTIRLPLAAILREFGDGALDELDTYSEIIWPDKLRRFQQSTAGNFIGIGIVIRHNDKREIMIVNPLEGAPAYFAGVKPNDIIMEVNGNSTVGWSLNDAVDRITGRKGTDVTIGLKREGEEDLVNVTITRDVIKIRSVKGWWKEKLDDDGAPIWDWYIDPVSRIAYIRLTQFTEDSYEDIKQAWSEIEADGGAAGLILDLRHNPGGLLTSAVQISGLFLDAPNTLVVTGEDKFGAEKWKQSARGMQAMLKDVPTVVLVNRGSASASEIVAGCLQAHHAALIVGERSFGKGSVQTIHHVARECRLKLTTQYYRLPSPDGGRTPGRLVHKRPGANVWGVDPDLEVKMSEQQIADAIGVRQKAELIPLDDDGLLDFDAEEREDVNRLLAEGLDPQLETALLILQAQAMSEPATEQRHARNEKVETR